MATPRQRWSRLQDELGDAPELLLLSTSTVEPLVPHIGLAVADREERRRVSVGEYGVVHQALVEASTAAAPPADIVVLTEFEGIFGHDWAPEQADRDVRRLVDALRRAAENGAHVWMALPVPPRPVEVADALPAGRLTTLRHAEVALLEAAEATPTLHVVDVPNRLGHHGDAAFDDRLWYFARQRFATGVLGELAGIFAEAIAASRRPPFKALALDCDGVLWGGVLGEDGSAGIQIGDEDPVGRAFQAVQQHLRRLVDRGVMLALCSKNDERDVWDVVDAHPGMVLRREHIAAAAIGWGPKSQGIREICETLKIHPSAVVFVDDNPAEVAEVAAREADARAVLTPKDPVELVRFFADQDWFLTMQVTAEDRARTTMMATERERSAHSASADAEDYLADLGLHVEIAEMDEERFARVHQLLHKTNQFNVTVRRHDEAALRRLLHQPGWTALTVTVDDRFGGYGLTGVAIAGPEDDALLVDTFLLSCRVLGRNVEDVLLAAVQDRARALGLERIRVPLVRTDRNAPAQGFVERRDFASAGEDVYELAADGPWWPSHVEVHMAESPV